MMSDSGMPAGGGREQLPQRQVIKRMRISAKRNLMQNEPPTPAHPSPQPTASTSSAPPPEQVEVKMEPEDTPVPPVAEVPSPFPSVFDLPRPSSPTALTSSKTMKFDVNVEFEDGLKDAMAKISKFLETKPTPVVPPPLPTASPRPAWVKDEDASDPVGVTEGSANLRRIFMNTPSALRIGRKLLPRPGTTLRDEANICYTPNLGSEPESDDSDDELVSPFIPRVLRTALETPKDADDDAVASDPTLADDSESLNDFEWKAFPNPPISPESRRETFSESNVGPSSPYPDPYAIFVDIWNQEFMEHIVSETNTYAHQITQKLQNLYPLPDSQWQDTTVDELYVYFGLIIATGFEVKSPMEEYWNDTSDAFHTSCFSAHMDINRFCLLNKYLHFSDNEYMCALGLKGSEAKLFKIQPLLSHLNFKFQSLYTLNQNICLDESLLQWTGCSQLFPKKAATMEIKTYEICEPQTGYLWRFEVHIHKKSPSQKLEDPLVASTPTTIILNLIRGLEHKGYTLWMDSFYNSPCLARRLKAFGFDCVGTLRTNRKFVPPDLHSLTKENMSPGQISGLTSGDVDVMVWKDKNRVAMISTYHGNAVAQVRGSTKPSLILDYNKKMRGLDKKDQTLAMYPIELKRTIWYKKLFRRLLNVSVLNAFIIHRHHCSSSKVLLFQESCNFRKFRMNLVTSLLAEHSFVPLFTTTIQQRFGDRHRLYEYPLHNYERQRWRCIVCKKLVTSYCVGCKKIVCVYPCFMSLHS